MYIYIYTYTHMLVGRGFLRSLPGADISAVLPVLVCCLLTIKHETKRLGECLSLSIAVIKHRD